VKTVPVKIVPVRRPAPGRRLAGLVLAGSLPLLAGCGTSPSGTSTPYDPSDGVSAAIGTVEVRNLLVVGTAANAPGVVSAALLNEAAEPVTVTVGTPEGASSEVEVPAQGSVLLGSQTGEPSASPGVGVARNAVVQFASLPKPPGATMQVTLSSPQGGTTTVTVPIMATQLEYATITPTSAPTDAPTDASTPANTPTSSERPSATDPGVTGTPGPTAEPSSSTTTRPVTPTAVPTGTASADPSVSSQ
jgi:hypothetical protein